MTVISAHCHFKRRQNLELLYMYVIRTEIRFCHLSDSSREMEHTVLYIYLNIKIYFSFSDTESIVEREEENWENGVTETMRNTVVREWQKE